MTYARPDRPGRRARRVAIAAAREQGCTCDVTATVARHVEGVGVVELHHDFFCGLLRSHEGSGSPATQLVMYRRDDGGES